jgi:hypothetical protein
LRVTCLNPPPGSWGGKETEFGLQEAQGRVHPGVEQPSGAVRYEADVRVQEDPKSGGLRLLGPFVHGPSAQRFLYLSYRHRDVAEWIGRIKVLLSAISKEQVEEALKEGRLLAAVVSGLKADGGRAWATVPLVGEGWTVIEARS